MIFVCGKSASDTYFQSINSKRQKLSSYFKTWSEKIDLSQLFCEIRCLPKLHTKWKYSAKIDMNEIWHLICGQNWTLYFKGGYSEGLVITFYDMEMLHKHTTYVLDSKLSFPVQLFLIGNFHFQFILILGRHLISQKSCDRSIFSLHTQKSYLLQQLKTWIKVLKL